jgi:hypothetical protein
MPNSVQFSVTVDDREFDVEHVGDVLRVTPRGAEDLAETVSLNHLTDEAREALERGDTDDAALQQAAEGIATAIADRGA